MATTSGPTLFNYLNRCVWTAVAGGTVAFTVGAAVTGYITPATAGAVSGANFRYFAYYGSTQWEVGYGVYTASGTTLTRGVIASSNSNALVNFTSSPTVAMGAPLAQDMVVTPDVNSGLPTVSNLVIVGGSPWIDVKGYGATGDGVTNDTAAIQAAINAAQLGGYTVFFPPGWYFITSTLTITAQCRLLGCGPYVSWISCMNAPQTVNHDITVLSISGNTGVGFIKELSIWGSNVNTTTFPSLQLQYNCAFNLDEVYALSGAGVQTGGISARYRNCSFGGWRYAVFSWGANFYSDCSFDSSWAASLPSGAVCFNQTIESSDNILENQFSNCDFSGDYSYSLIVNTSAAFIKTFSCIFSNAVQIQNAKFVSFIAAEFGSTVTNSIGVNCCVVGSMAFSGITISGASKAANLNIS